MSYDVVLALPTEDRGRAHAFARALGLETPGDLADDGVPEPLRVTLNERTAVMYIPTGGFGWVTAGRPTAGRDTAECLVSLQVSATTRVDDLLERAATGGGEIVSPAQQKSWGYTGTFTDPDGHLWEAIVSAI
jgi:predicted lactoylglutathione lyase